MLPVAGKPDQTGFGVLFRQVVHQLARLIGLHSESRRGSQLPSAALEVVSLASGTASASAPVECQCLKLQQHCILSSAASIVPEPGGSLTMARRETTQNRTRHTLRGSQFFTDFLSIVPCALGRWCTPRHWRCALHGACAAAQDVFQSCCFLSCSASQHTKRE